MEKYLIDTNVISDYFCASLPKNGLNFLDSVIDMVPFLSVITEIELLSWRTRTETELIIKEFISDSVILELSEDVVYRCIDIRRNKLLKIPDAIIAATALCHNMILITNNEKDFRNIQELRILNPFKL